MGINLNGSIGSLYLGSTKIVEAYLGSVKVFGSSQPVIVLPAKTIRFKFSNTNYQPTTGSGSNNTSTIGTWTVVNASQGIWDWYYNNTSWGSDARKFNLNSTTIGGTVDILAGNLDGVTSTLRLFWGTSALPNDGLNTVSGIYNTTSLLDMGSMFEYCTGITSIALFDTSNVTSWYFTFARLANLTSLPLFNTSSCVDFNSALKECHSLTHIPALDFSSCNDANNLFLNSYMIDNAKHLFNEICMSPAGLNGNYNTNTFKLTGSNSENDQRARIPTIIGGTKVGVSAASSSGSLGRSKAVSLEIHPGYAMSASVTRYTGSTASTATVSITNNTTEDKINMINVSATANRSSNSKSVSTNAYLGYDYSHTNNVNFSWSNSAYASGNGSWSYSATKYEYDLLD